MDEGERSGALKMGVPDAVRKKLPGGFWKIISHRRLSVQPLFIARTL